MSDLVNAVKEAIQILSAALPADAANKTVGPGTVLALMPVRLTLYANGQKVVFQTDAGGFDTASFDQATFEANPTLKQGFHGSITYVPGGGLYGTDKLVSITAS